LNNITQPQRNFIEKKYGVSISDPNTVQTLLDAWVNEEVDCLYTEDLQGVPWFRLKGYYMPDGITGSFTVQYYVGLDMSFPFPYSPNYVEQKYSGSNFFFQFSFF
jgi:hypothetical protein